MASIEHIAAAIALDLHKAPRTSHVALIIYHLARSIKPLERRTYALAAIRAQPFF